MEARSEIVSSYDTTEVLFGSEGFDSHRALVASVYSAEGFIKSSNPEDLNDKYDASTATYYLLASKEKSDVLDGTFRILRDTEFGLPTFFVYPNESIRGISSHLCESTRVVSVKRNLSGRSNPGRNILFEVVIQSLVFTRRNNLYGVISLGSTKVFEWINEVFSGTQRAFAAPQDYQGGIVVPSIIWVDEFEKLLKQNKPEIYDYYERSLYMQN